MTIVIGTICRCLTYAQSIEKGNFHCPGWRGMGYDETLMSSGGRPFPSTCCIPDPVVGI